VRGEKAMKRVSRGDPFPEDHEESVPRRPLARGGCPMSRRGDVARGWAAMAVLGLSLSLSLFLVSCGDGGSGTEPTPAPVARVDVSPSTGSVQVGGTLRMAATPRDAAGHALAGRSVTWASDNEGVVRVASGGLATGVGAGTATVTATSEGRSGSAALTVPSFTLAVVREGVGTGRVSSAPAGIDCGATCSASFGVGALVTLTAAADTDAAFLGWSGACSGTGGACQVTMGGVRSVTAVFGRPSHALTVAKEGAGSGRVTSSPEGIDCGTVCSTNFEAGRVVTLTASASGASVFTGWGGACSGTGSTCQMAMDGARAVTAAFGPAAATRRLTVWKSGGGDGTVTSLPEGIECGAKCAADFAQGSVVTLTAAPGTGSVFVLWSGACSGSGSTCQLPMQEARLVMAEFGEIKGPHVVSTVPEVGAATVDPGISTVEFRFSEPMADCGGFTTSGWWPWTKTWSPDRRTMFVTRGTAGTSLYGQQVSIRPMGCVSQGGSPLAADFTLTFRTAHRNPPIRVAPDPAKGFYWPYYLAWPTQMASPPTLLVEPNNTGTWSDDLQVHDASAKTLLNARIPFAEDLGSPLLVPVFPRPVLPQAPEPGGIYVHALDRYSLTNDHPGLRRIDLQMVAMMDDALDRLEAMGHVMDRRVFMMGFSASGAFTSRFALIHPDRVKAAAPGAPGGWPLAPVASWQGTPLKYAVGVMDLKSLVGKPFDLETFKSVPLYIYVGDRDTNDALDVRGMTTTERDQIYALLEGSSTEYFQANRWPLAQAMYESVGANARFVVYPGVGHTLTTQILADVKAFFRERR
jgi:hypothetical protein